MQFVWFLGLRRHYTYFEELSVIFLVLLSENIYWIVVFLENVIKIYLRRRDKRFFQKWKLKSANIVLNLEMEVDLLSDDVTEKRFEEFRVLGQM
jgi:hypothetical protein